MSSSGLFRPSSHLHLGTHAPHLPFCDVRLNQAEQRYHGLIVGKSGSGKSKLLQHLMLERIDHSLREQHPQGTYSSHGATVLEPHHDLSWDILNSLVARGFYKRPDAYERVVYLDFARDWYLPFNVLAGDGDPHERASLCLDAILRVFPELETAPLFTELFLCGVVTLIANQLPLTALHRLYTDPDFRQACLRRVVQDEVVTLTFRHFDDLGRDQAQAAGSTVRRAVQLVFNATTRLSLGQPENLLPLRQFMDEGRFVILNLGGIRDALSRKILGALLMVHLEQAALSRIDLLPHERVQHTVMVDEWPVFAATEDSLGHILSQARKYSLNILLACQSLSQISQKRLSGAFENCKLGVFFGLGQQSAEISSRQIGELDPYTLKSPQQQDWESATDNRSPTQHDQYLPLLEQIQVWTNELKHLTPRHCYVKVDTKPALKVRTPMVQSLQPDPGELAEVLATYRQRYQRSRVEAERALVYEARGAPLTDQIATDTGGSTNPWLWS